MHNIVKFQPGTTPCPQPPGLALRHDMNKPILPLTYEQLGQWIESLQPALRAENFAVIVGILRGGAPLALMASHVTGAPVAFLRYDRSTRAVTWDSTLPLPEPGSRVLLCEDIAGLGFTLTDCIAFLREHGLTVRTLTGAYDDLSRLRPDYSIDADSFFTLFPQERQSYTERYRSSWSREGAETDALIATDREYATYAIDLDGIVPPDTPLAAEDDFDATVEEREALQPFRKFSGVETGRVRAVVTDRAEAERARVQKWLERQGFNGVELIMRGAGPHDASPSAQAAHKAEAAQRCGVTYFVEGDPLEAILIAQQAPLLHVVWWNAHTQSGTLIGASAWR